MVTVNAFTAERSQAIEDAAIESTRLDNGELILIRHDTTEINVGNVSGQPDVKCSLTHNQAFGVANDTWTPQLFNTEDYDTDAMHDNITNNTRITIKTAGVYLFEANIVFVTGTTGVTRSLGLRKNGAGYNDAPNAGMVSISPGASGLTPALHICRAVAMVVNDFMEVVMYHDQGSQINSSSAMGMPHFSATRINV